MKIGIIGLGFVGEAIYWAHRNDERVVRDPKFEDSADYNKFLDCDGIFICVPTPTTDNGSCDASILEQVLKELYDAGISEKIPLICKSTATPSIYNQLLKEYPSIIHCPEFLTAANATADYQNSRYFVLGGNGELCVTARDVIRSGVPLVHRQFLVTDIKSAALYKYMMNAYLATKVTFMNEFYKLAKAENVSFESLKDLTIYDDRIGYTHLNVPGPDGKFGWGGHCFPKDISAIQIEASGLGIDLELLKQINNINNKDRNIELFASPTP